MLSSRTTMPDITIRGTTPSKKNSKIIKCNGARPLLFPSSAYKKWHKDALLQLAEQKVKKKKIPFIHTITLTFFSPTRRAFDLTNKAESIMDLLVDYGFMEDDNFKVVPNVQLIYGGVSKAAPRCEIEYDI